MDLGRGIIACALTTMLVCTIGWAARLALRELRRTRKYRKYKNRFPDIIVDDGYGDIHRTIYPNELLAVKLFSLCYRDRDEFARIMHAYIHNELKYAKKQRKRSKGRRYELIIVHNAMTLIRREYDGLGDT